MKNIMHDVFSLFCQKNPDKIIVAVRDVLKENQLVINTEDLSRVEQDYHLMLNAMRQGYIDPKRNKIFNNIIDRLYIFIMNVNIDNEVKNMPDFDRCAQYAVKYNHDYDTIRNRMEGFVTDVAMLSLYNETIIGGKGSVIYKKHGDYMSSLFCYILTSHLWRDNDKQFFTSLLLSKTIETSDALLLLGAITLANFFFYDIRKFKTLMEVYRQTTDVFMRQRALVGWALTADDNQIYKEQEEILEAACKEKIIQDELLSLQKQILYCCDSENVKDEVQRDIVSPLMKYGNIDTYKFGKLTEKDHDTIEDIINPSADDERNEKIEESIQRFNQMQQEGKDVFYAGFSAMKTFSFFQNLSNWLLPFDENHPDLNKLRKVLGNNLLIKNVKDNTPFCDSDKYSFVLALSVTIERLPAEVLEMLNYESAFSMPENVSIDDETFVRRRYLQDLYRLFTLHYERLGDYINPFDNSSCLFLAKSCYKETDICNRYPDLCLYFHKKGFTDAFDRMVNECMDFMDIDDAKSLFVQGVYLYDIEGEMYQSLYLFERLHELKPESMWVKLYLANIRCSLGDLEEAEDLYRELHELYPENRNFAFRYAQILVDLREYDDALNILYRLDYEAEESKVKDEMANVFLEIGKLEQAEKKLLEAKELTDYDTNSYTYFYLGIVHWAKGMLNEAVHDFQCHLKNHSHSTDSSVLSLHLKENSELLKQYGIGNDCDICMMCDLVTKFK